MDPAINESLKNVAKVKNMIKTFIELNCINDAVLLYVAIEILEETEEILAKSQ